MNSLLCFIESTTILIGIGSSVALLVYGLWGLF